MYVTVYVCNISMYECMYVYVVCISMYVCMYVCMYVRLHKQLIYFQNFSAVLSWLCYGKGLISSLSTGGITLCRWQYVACELRVERTCSAVQAVAQFDGRSVAVTFVFDVPRGMPYVLHSFGVKCNVTVCLALKTNGHVVLRVKLHVTFVLRVKCQVLLVLRVNLKLPPVFRVKLHENLMSE
jgi:hypothetical protein